MPDLAFPHGGNIYEIERRYIHDDISHVHTERQNKGARSYDALYRRDIIDFSASINPLGLTRRTRRKIIENMDRISHYPDPCGTDLIKKISGYFALNEENILLGNGSVELIYLITSAVRPKKVLIPIPAFSEYESASRLIEAKVQFIKLREDKGFTLDMPGRIEADIVFISNPNNPTANLLIKNKMINGSGGKKLFVIDEAFMDFLPDEKKHTLIYRAVKDKGLIVLRSFTKFFGLPGLRIGYLVAHRDLVKKLKRYIIPWNVNTMAQLAAEEVLRDKVYIMETQRFIENERDFLSKQISGFADLAPYPSVTNFILVKIKNKKITSLCLRDSLIKKGIVIRDCSNFRNLDNSFIRIAVRMRNENLRLIAGLKSVFGAGFTKFLLFLLCVLVP